MIRLLARLCIGLVLFAGTASSTAQSRPPWHAYEGGDFLGFTVDARMGKGWGFARPSDLFPTLFSVLTQEPKEPGWFPVSSQELPLAVTWVSLPGKHRGVRSEYQLTFAKKKPQLAVVYVRASWIKGATHADRAELLRALTEARQEEFKTQVPKLLDYRSSTDHSLGSECLRIEARFLEKSSHPQEVVTTRRFLCPHPDMPAYIVELGYGERSGPESDLKVLETELRSFWSSFHFRPLEGNLKELPGSHVTAIPVGCFAGAITATPDAIWVSAGHRLLVRIDPHTGRVVDSVDVKKPVTGIVPLGNDLWLSTNSSDVLLRLNVPTKEVAKVRLKDAEALGLKDAAGLVYGRPPAIVTLDGTEWAVLGGGDLVWVDPGRGEGIGDPLHISIAGYSGAEYIAAGDGALWLSSESAGVVYRIELHPATFR